MHKCLPLLLSCLSLYSCTDEAPVQTNIIRPAKVITVGDQYLQTRDIPGTVRASQRSELSFQVPGQIIELNIREGQKVQKGYLLARLDASDYQSSVSAKRAEMTKFRSNFERAKELITGKFISQSEYDTIKAAYEVAVASLEQAQKALRDSQLTAPFTGLVARRFVENFEDVQAKQPILSLQGSDNLEIVVAVSETLIARRTDEPNFDLSAKFDAIPETSFELHLIEFATEADPQTQTFEYVLGITAGSPRNILPGMTATVTITRRPDEVAGPLTVPMAAIFAGENDAKHLWVVDDDNKVSARLIQTGELAGQDHIVVHSGLEIGELIVVAGAGSLDEGREIKPITQVIY